MCVAVVPTLFLPAAVCLVRLDGWKTQQAMMVLIEKNKKKKHFIFQCWLQYFCHRQYMQKNSIFMSCHCHSKDKLFKITITLYCEQMSCMFLLKDLYVCWMHLISHKTFAKSCLKQGFKQIELSLISYILWYTTGTVSTDIHIYILSWC